MKTRREFPDWEQLYREKETETLPWYHPYLDADLERALAKFNLIQGKVLDLGTGPGTQAMALAQRGFSVTATDISATAIEKAKALARQKELGIEFIQDDILNTNLKPAFDFIFDRGCFHALPPERRPDYVGIVYNLLKPGGYLFLKCFSYKETSEEGPYRFSPEEITAIFGTKFNIISIEEGVFRSTLPKDPLSLFCIMQKADIHN